MKQHGLRRGLVTAGATAVLVAWGMVFWGLLSPPLGMFHAAPGADRIAEALEREGAVTGTYFFPWPRDTPEAAERFVAQHRSGPFYKLSYIAEGVDPQSPKKLLIGCLHYAVVAALAVALVALAGLRRYRRRVALVVLAGTLGSVFITLADPIWFHLPWDYTVGALLYELVAWTLLGLVAATGERAGDAASAR